MELKGAYSRFMLRAGIFICNNFFFKSSFSGKRLCKRKWPIDCEKRLTSGTCSKWIKTGNNLFSTWQVIKSSGLYTPYLIVKRIIHAGFLRVTLYFSEQRIQTASWTTERICSYMKVFKLKAFFFLLWSRGAMMEQMADRHMLSRNYIKWKIKCDMEQKNGVASLHYKYGSNLHCLLYKNSAN